MNLKKRRILLTAALTVLLLLGAGCAAGQDTLTQVSFIDALLAGAYDGQETCGWLVSQGDLGLGTFDRLDGEMIVLDGAVYRACYDGTVERVPDHETTPFAAVARFKPDLAFAVSGGEDAVKKEILARLPDRNAFTAIRVDGRFRHIEVRSVPAQEKPYPVLTEVTPLQHRFNLENAEGTLVGFYCPPYVSGVNVPGFHLHFITNDRKQGGHVLGFEGAEGKAALDRLDRFVMVLPQDPGALKDFDFTKSRKVDLDQVETAPPAK